MNFDKFTYHHTETILMNFRPLFFLFLLILANIYSVNAQRFVFEHGDITFISKATIEDIRSKNEKIKSVFSLSSGNIAFSVPIRDFNFEKHLMEEHLNDKYMESQTYPRQPLLAG